MPEFFEMTDEDRELVDKVLANPLRYPRVLATWIKNLIETDPPRIPIEKVITNFERGGYDGLSSPFVTIDPTAPLNDGDTISYNGTDQKWEPVAPSGGGGPSVPDTASFMLLFDGNVVCAFKADMTYEITAVSAVAGSGAGTATFSFRVNGGAPTAGLPPVGAIFNPGDEVEITAAGNSGTRAYVTLTAEVS